MNFLERRSNRSMWPAAGEWTRLRSLHARARTWGMNAQKAKRTRLRLQDSF